MEFVGFELAAHAVDAATLAISLTLYACALVFFLSIFIEATINKKKIDKNFRADLFENVMYLLSFLPEMHLDSECLFVFQTLKCSSMFGVDLEYLQQ